MSCYILLETAFGEKNRQKFKELAITEGPDFRPFVVSLNGMKPPQGTENLMKEMQPYLGSLSAHEQTVISFYLFELCRAIRDLLCAAR